MPTYNYTSATPENITDNTMDVLSNASKNNSNLFGLLKSGNTLSNSAIDTIDTTMENSQAYVNSAINNMSSLASATQNNLDAVSNNLVNQMVVNDVINTEIANTQAEYDTLLENNINKRRLIENNTYYTQRYEAHTELMKTIIIICIPLLLIAILGNKGLLPGNLAYWLGGIGLLIGLGIIGVKIFNLYNRDNFNFNEYTQPFYLVKDQKEIDAGKNYSITAELENEFSQLGKNLEDDLGTCFGSDCCGQGLQYVSAKRKCEIKESQSSALAASQDTATFSDATF